MVSKTYIKEKIIRLYWKEKKSTTEVAKEVGVSQQYIIKFMKENDIARRSKRESLRLYWRKLKEDGKDV